jgi:uncharacterized membrane protein
LNLLAGGGAAMLAEGSRLTKALLNVPRRILSIIWDVLSKPSAFALAHIESSPASTRRALVFYLNVFGALFIAVTVTSHFYYYSGASEVREIALLATQVALAIPILWLINRMQAAAKRPSMPGILQGVLYVDAVFLIFITAFSIGLGFFTYSGSKEEIDILATEWERCVASKSVMYWLVRGELQFHYEPPQAEAIRTIRQWGELAQFVIVIPFAHLFARMMKARFGAYYWLNLIGAVLTFAFVVLSTSYAVEQYQFHLARKADCATDYMKASVARHNRERLAEQLVMRANTEFGNVGGTPGNYMRFDGQSIVMVVNYPLAGEAFDKASSGFQGLMTDWYCNPDTELAKVRHLDLPLRLTMTSTDGRTLQPVIDNKLCYERPHFSLGTSIGEHFKSINSTGSMGRR